MTDSPPLHPEPPGWQDRDFIDFPAGWWLADIVEHTDPRCSYAQTDGAMLCDCGAIQTEWERRRHLPKRPLGRPAPDASDREVERWLRTQGIVPVDNAVRAARQLLIES